MAEYKEIKGVNIKNISGDPPVVNDGDIWYNTSLDKLRVKQGPTVGGWSTLSPTPLPQTDFGMSGDSTGSIIFGGRDFYTGPAPGPTAHNNAISQKWDGTTWTGAPALNNKRQEGMGFGSSDTNGFYATGATPNAPGPGYAFTSASESWNGSSWTSKPGVNNSRVVGGGAGTNTAGIIAQGYFFHPFVTYSNTESWNGSSWTTVNSMNTNRYLLGMGGTSTSAIGAGGSGKSNSSESWNGTSWTATPNLNNGRERIGGAADSNTKALVFSGENSPDQFNGITESWNGSSWTNVNNMVTTGPSVRTGFEGGQGATNALAVHRTSETTTEAWSDSGAGGNRSVESA